MRSVIPLDTSVNITVTARTVIDCITLEDAPFFVSLVNTPDWLRFIGNPNVTNVDDARRYLEGGFLQSYRDNGFGYYIVRINPSREPIGICGFLKKPNLDNPDFGFGFLPDHYRKGFALESCRAILDFGIHTFAFTLLDAVTCTDNVRSMRLLQKLDFQRQRLVDSDNPDNPLVLFRWWQMAQQGDTPEPLTS